MHEVGWAHPSTANWNYGVWNVYSSTGAATQCKETFGGDYRLAEKLEAAGYTVKKYTSFTLGKYPVRYTHKLLDIESEEVFNLLIQ